jgi:hypothetical protein
VGLRFKSSANNGDEKVFKVKAMFEDYDIAMWFVDGECDDCGTLLTVPCPVDDPDVQR